MQLVHRVIDPSRDRDYVLERHCRINYECDCPWARADGYEAYRARWFRLASQIAEFWGALERSIADERSIAEVIETADGQRVGYLWAPFWADEESGFFYVDVQDVYIESPFRRAGISTDLMAYAERRAKEGGAKVIRSGTGCGNLASIALHEKLGYRAYRIEFEKML